MKICCPQLCWNWEPETGVCWRSGWTKSESSWRLEITGRSTDMRTLISRTQKLRECMKKFGYDISHNLYTVLKKLVTHAAYSYMFYVVSQTSAFSMCVVITREIWMNWDLNISYNNCQYTTRTYKWKSSLKLSLCFKLETASNSRDVKPIRIARGHTCMGGTVTEPTN
jgi:hypothetical protein